MLAAEDFLSCYTQLLSVIEDLPFPLVLIGNLFFFHCFGQQTSQSKVQWIGDPAVIKGKCKHYKKAKVDQETVSETLCLLSRGAICVRCTTMVVMSGER